MNAKKKMIKNTANLINKHDFPTQESPMRTSLNR